VPEQGRSRTWLAVLALVALIVLTVDFREGQGGPLTTLQRGAMTVFAPVQEGFAAVLRPVADFFAAVGQVGDLREDNAALADEVERLRGELPPAQDLLRENAELRALLEMRQRLGFDTVAAQVIGQPPGQVSFSVIIDAGADEGLAPGMAVVNAEGLVGKLTEVTRRHARVELLSSPDARYAVRTAPSGETGLMQGSGTRPFRLEMRDPSVRVDAGDQVVTRTFEGSTIPAGIPVGVVSDSSEQASSRYRGVRPYVDFSRLSVVQVVTNAGAQPSELPPEELVEPPERPRPRVSPAVGEAGGRRLAADRSGGAP
jgi:rod shape-determining protein MreC